MESYLDCPICGGVMIENTNDENEVVCHCSICGYTELEEIIIAEILQDIKDKEDCDLILGIIGFISLIIWFSIFLAEM